MPLSISVIFLWSNAACPCRNNTIPTYKVSLQDTTCPLKRRNVNFQRSNHLIFFSVEQYTFGQNTYFRKVRSIIDIEHPSQHGNMFENLSTLIESTSAPYNRTLSYVNNNFPMSKPRDQPSLHVLWSEETTLNGSPACYLRIKNAHSSI